MAPWLSRRAATSVPSSYRNGQAERRTRARARERERERERERDMCIILLFFPLSHISISRSLLADLFIYLPTYLPTYVPLRADSVGLSLFIFAHSLMQHIASCTGGNDVGRGEGKGGRDWTGQSVQKGMSRNNVLAHFLKPPPSIRRAGRMVVGVLRGEKKVTDARRGIGASVDVDTHARAYSDPILYGLYRYTW